MASSSSPPSKPQWKYDVFVNFRGTLRNKFISHLTDAMKREEIEYFIDVDMPKGRLLRPELMQAIEGSRIALVVFSGTYTKSDWCLDELVKIMECRTYYGQLVLPICYNIKVNSIRHLKGVFGKSLEELAQRKFCREEKRQEELSKWKNALLQASNLAVFSMTNCRDEAELVKKIVGQILSTINNTKLFNTYFPVGLLDSTEQKVMGFAESRGVIGLLEQLVVSMDVQNYMAVLAGIMPSSHSKLRSVLLQYQPFKLSRRIRDDVYGANFTDELKISLDTSQFSKKTLEVLFDWNRKLPRSLQFQYSQREHIRGGDKSRNWLTQGHTSEGVSVFFVVPQNSDCRRLKGMALGVYSRSMAAECLTSVLVVNYTKCTIQLYQRDTVISFNDEDWKGLISSLEPGDRIEIFATFRHKLAIKKTAVFLLYDVPNNVQMVPSPELKPVTGPSTITGVVAQENCFQRLLEMVLFCNFCTWSA